MKDETTKLNEELIFEALKSSTKIHITLKDGSWRNGFVTEIKADFFMFDDKENGIEPFFFLQLKEIKPYIEEKEKEDWVDGDKLTCLKCDGFVSSLNKKGLCSKYEEEK